MEDGRSGRKSRAVFLLWEIDEVKRCKVVAEGWNFDIDFGQGIECGEGIAVGEEIDASRLCEIISQACQQ